MKKYTALKIEIASAYDVITTSAMVTTDKIQLPWSKSTPDTTNSNSSFYELSDLTCGGDVEISTFNI